MTITALMAQLQTILTAHGDLDVFCEDSEWAIAALRRVQYRHEAPRYGPVDVPREHVFLEAIDPEAA